MTNEGFPRDDYTPHGLLANPYAVAHSWKDSSGGVLRTSREGIGVGWVYPWALGAEAYAELGLEVGQGERPLLDEADNLRDRVRAPHHSARLLELAWEAFGYRWTASFVLVAADQLALVVAAERVSVQSDRDSGLSTAADQVPYVRVGLHGWRKQMEDRRASVAATPQDRALDGKPSPGGCHVGSVSLGAPYGVHALYVDGSDALPAYAAPGCPRS
jgi:hypothetical protein